MIHFHKYKEIDRYLMFAGEDRIFLKCEKCNKEKIEYSLETYNGIAKAPSYAEWEKNRAKC